MTATIIVPTYNERGNVRELVHRLTAVLSTADAEVLFVDDSDDDTPDIIRELSGTPGLLPVRLLHRPPEAREDGLSGAVTAGITLAGDHVVVMDGDLQHPPELVPVLLDQLDKAELVVASRYTVDGDAGGLSSSWRRLASSGSTLLVQACFPKRVGRVCTDPMTGFFAFRRGAVDIGRLRPRGFKILLEILARHDLAVVDVPFAFGERFSGASKASMRNGFAFLHQLASLRMGRMSRFAAVGILGTVVNLLVMWLLLLSGSHYLIAAVVAAEVSILHNFLLQERFVFRDVKGESRASWGQRCLLSLLINNAETLARMPLLALVVTGLGMYPLAGQAITLAAAFLVRFLFVTHVVYRPHRVNRVVAEEATLEGELS